MVIDCDDSTTCVGNTYTCTEEICQLNCNAEDSCEGAEFTCDDSYLHSSCQLNCNGRGGCRDMYVESHRDTNIYCGNRNSCDDMNVEIYGDYPNDKINSTATFWGGYTDSTVIECHGEGIDECFVDCQDNNDYYSCIGVTLDCYTPGTCRYRCENNDACCGCYLSCGLFCSKLWVNKLNCYWGTDNCIQVNQSIIYIN